MKKRLRILNISELKPEFHGRTGTLIETKDVAPPSGKPWIMLTVELDEMVPTKGVDGYIEHKTVCFPEECFEEILC